MRPGLICLLVCGGLGTASATPLLEPHVGGPVFVGPTSPGVASIFWNPAAAGLEHGFHALLQAGGRWDLDSIDRKTITSSSGEPDPAGDRSFGSVGQSLLSPGG